MEAVLWIVLAIALAIAEAFTASFLVVFFAVGALAAGGAAALGAPVLVQATVLEEVDADHGLIKIDGELWTARSFDGTEKFLPGERVRVIKVRGATAIVWRDDMPNY